MANPGAETPQSGHNVSSKSPGIGPVVVPSLLDSDGIVWQANTDSRRRAPSKRVEASNATGRLNATEPGGPPGVSPRIEASGEHGGKPVSSAQGQILSGEGRPLASRWLIKTEPAEYPFEDLSST